MLHDSRRWLLIALVSLAAPLTAHADPLLWYGARNVGSPRNWLRGADECRPGQHCLYCTADVRGQFASSWATGNAQWTPDWSAPHPPSSRRPSQAFDDGHFQGVTSLQSDWFARYVLTHSDPDASDDGDLVILGAAGTDTELTLTTIFPFPDSHPSPPLSIGYFAGAMASDSGAQTSSLRLFDARFLFESQDVHHDFERTHPDEPFVRGGNGIGIAPLAEAGYLMIASSRAGSGSLYGGYPDGSIYASFYYLEGDLAETNGLNRMEYLGSQHLRTSGGDDAQSEAMSLLVECDTGDVYAVHTDGARYTAEARLSKFVWDGEPHLELVDRRSMSQNLSTCNVYSGATVSADAYGLMSLACTEKKAGDERNDLRIRGTAPCQNPWVTGCN
ncbi:MAG: hypothetical protein CMN30_01010 [Sandaracinus sp.]|nr:hypothetical protein [Sandaracinus sp.]